MARKPGKGRGRPKGSTKGGPKAPYHVEIDVTLLAKLREEIARQRRSNRAVTEDMIEKYLKSPDRPNDESK